MLLAQIHKTYAEIKQISLRLLPQKIIKKEIHDEKKLTYNLGCN